MIRRGKFTRVETVILWVFASLLVVAGGAGLFLSADHGHWRLALASIGVLGIAVTYVLAARRGKAIEEANVLGWQWSHDDPLDAIAKEWSAAFRMDTWRPGRRDLFIESGEELRSHSGLLRRLAPQRLTIQRGGEWRDFSVLATLPELRGLAMRNCAKMTSLDALAPLGRLQSLSLGPCLELTDLSTPRSLPKLRELRLDECAKMTDLDWLAAVPQLNQLWLEYCTALRNVGGLNNLSNLAVLSVEGSSVPITVPMLGKFKSLRILIGNDSPGAASASALQEASPELRMLTRGTVKPAAMARRRAALDRGR